MDLVSTDAIPLQMNGQESRRGYTTCPPYVGLGMRTIRVRLLTIRGSCARNAHLVKQPFDPQQSAP